MRRSLEVLLFRDFFGELDFTRDFLGIQKTRRFAVKSCCVTAKIYNGTAKNIQIYICDFKYFSDWLLLTLVITQAWPVKQSKLTIPWL